MSWQQRLLYPLLMQSLQTCMQCTLHSCSTAIIWDNWEAVLSFLSCNLELGDILVLRYYRDKYIHDNIITSISAYRDNRQTIISPLLSILQSHCLLWNVVSCSPAQSQVMFVYMCIVVITFYYFSYIICCAGCAGCHYLGGSLRNVLSSHRYLEILQTLSLGHGETFSCVHIL